VSEAGFAMEADETQQELLRYHGNAIWCIDHVTKKNLICHNIIHIHAPQTDNPIIGRSSAPKTECKDRAVKWVTDNGKRSSINYDK
jgi:hypothetical protein